MQAPASPEWRFVAAPGQAVVSALGERSILSYLTGRVLHTTRDAFQER